MGNPIKNPNTLYHPRFTMAELEMIFKMANHQLASPLLISSPNERNLLESILISCGSIIKRVKLYGK